MPKIGAYEAKTKLASLLERVAEGEHITITRHGLPVATLSPVPEHRRRPAAEVIADLRAFRRGRRLGRTPLKKLIEEGRR
ncbi:MAG TPA: type II toxin-antitoxin system prevent-host-death family antitoxin [Thermoanaerobaculales bacterium]|nr:type II toxin-antitoxin system prevent-host-death family antitoxin [Thermoanaerobaculales bacterium]